MIIANFDKGSTREDVFRIYQYDYGQVLRIQGLTLPTAVEVHFSLQNTGGEATTRIGVTKDGVTDVVIPDSFLENGYTTQNYEIYAFVYLRDETSGQTEYKITLHIISRPKPEAFDRPEDAELFREAIKAVNESAARSAESEKQAEGWAHGREDLPERAQDNAKYYSDQAREDSAKTDADRKEVRRLVESVSGIGEQVEKVESLTKQAQTSATNAALSEQAAKESENNAAQARAGAEAAEDNAELASQRAEQDKAIVEQAKNIVKQMGQEVLDNKNLVDEAAQDFDLKAQQALADVNNAGQAQTERVQTAGNDAVESVKAAQGTATRAVETAKTEAIEAIQTEGATQAGNVSAEGEKQVQAVRGAAQEIIADREQIQENKTGIAKLKEDLSKLDNDLYRQGRINLFDVLSVVKGKKDRSWCSSSGANDHRAVTIEVADDNNNPWHCSDAAMKTLVELCADICRRNGIAKLVYTGDTSGNLTMHKWFAATDCPGAFLENRFQWIADEVNKKLGISTAPAPAPKPQPAQPAGNQIVKDGQVHARNFASPGLMADGIRGANTKRAGIRALQQAMNLDYHVGLALDGIWGSKSERALGRHTVRRGETQYMVTALQILLMLKGYNPSGLENPGIFGSGTEAAVRKYQADHRLTVDGIAGYNTFKSLIQ